MYFITLKSCLNLVSAMLYIAKRRHWHR